MIRRTRGVGPGSGQLAGLGSEGDVHQAAIALDLEDRGVVGLELLDGGFQRGDRLDRLSVQLRR